MISVGIDVSKEKSTVCILKPYGEVIKSPFDVNHTQTELNNLVKLLNSLTGEIKVVMEATGYYHYPILNYLQENNFFVSVINALVMNKYSNIAIRKGKTDKKDALKIANYGLDFWFKLMPFKPKDDVYEELTILSRQYYQCMSIKVKCKITLLNLLDKTMPKITELLSNNTKTPGKCKLNDFANKFWHYDNITKYSKNQFNIIYNNWAKKEGYRQSQSKAAEIYALACDSIPTLSSATASAKMLVTEAVRVLKEVDYSLNLILSHMEQLAKQLKEYSTVLAMNGVGIKLVLLLIAEIGNVARFHNSKALIAYAGIDSPPHQSGSFSASRRRISKRGSKYLRTIGYQVMTSINISKNESCPVYQFMQKKEAEGKAKKVAKIAGLNKFLRIYYARIKEVTA